MNTSEIQNVSLESNAKILLQLLNQYRAIENDQKKQEYLDSCINCIQVSLDNKAYETVSGRKKMALLILDTIKWGEHVHFLTVIANYLL